MIRPTQRGVTLMELLIAVTLLSLLIAGVLTSMRVGVNAMQRSNARIIANRKVLGTQRLIEQQIASLLPVMAPCIGSGGPSPGEKIAFFQGEPYTMRLVSTYSLAEGARGYPRILEFQVIPGEENKGVRLVVNEHLYTGPLSAGIFCLGMMPDPAAGISVPRFVPVQIGSASFVIADKLAGARFIYRQLLPDPPFEKWVPRWVATNWPASVRIEMAPLEADASKISPVSLTIPLKISRSPYGGYID